MGIPRCTGLNFFQFIDTIGGVLIIECRLMITLTNSLPEWTQVSRGVVNCNSGTWFSCIILLDLTQSTAAPSPTTTSSTALTQTTSASSSPSTSTANSRANAVRGGVVGGILGLFMLCALLYGYFQWKKRLARNREVLLSRTASDTGNLAANEVVEEPSMTQVGVINLIPPRSDVPSFVSTHSWREDIKSSYSDA